MSMIAAEAYLRAAPKRDSERHRRDIAVKARRVKLGPPQLTNAGCEA